MRKYNINEERKQAAFKGGNVSRAGRQRSCKLFLMHKMRQGEQY